MLNSLAKVVAWIYFSSIIIAELLYFVILFLHNSPIVLVSILSFIIYPTLLNFLFLALAFIVSYVIARISVFYAIEDNIAGFYSTCSRNDSLIFEWYPIEEYIDEFLLKKIRRDANIIEEIYVLRLITQGDISNNVIIPNAIYFFGGVYMILTPYKPEDMSQTSKLVLFHELGHTVHSNNISTISIFSRNASSYLIILTSLLVTLANSLSFGMIQPYVIFTISGLVIFALHRNEKSVRKAVLDSEILADNFSVEWTYKEFLETLYNLTPEQDKLLNKKFIEWIEAIEKEASKENGFIPPIDTKLDKKHSTKRKIVFIENLNKLKEHYRKKSKIYFELDWLPSLSYFNIVSVVVFSFIISLGFDIDKYNALSQLVVFSLMLILMVTLIVCWVHYTKLRFYNENLIVDAIKSTKRRRTLGELYRSLK
ncbi:AC76 family protein [Vibrio alfacsensis]|uniref:AC76 family protein n=1 Tax=Vibrio alfacsensis TaxID=1074311 RepID=UPI00406790A9